MARIHDDAVYLRPIDGDTVLVQIVLMELQNHQRIILETPVRIIGISAPESVGVEKSFGDICTQALLDYFGTNRACEIVQTKAAQATPELTERSEKYGRMLGDIRFPDEPRTLGKWLLDNGWAKKWNGKGPRPDFDMQGVYPLQPEPELPEPPPEA